MTPDIEQLVHKLQALRDQDTEISSTDPAIWTCTVGSSITRDKLPGGSHLTMRTAVHNAYKTVLGSSPDYLFSGWGTRLTESQLAVVEARQPNASQTDWALLDQAINMIVDLSEALSSN